MCPSVSLSHPASREKPVWVARFDRKIKDVTVYCSERLVKKREKGSAVLNSFQNVKYCPL